MTSNKTSDMTTGKTSVMTSDTTMSQLAYLTRALRAPAIRDSAHRLAETAREHGWSHEDYLAAVLDREVAARAAHGADARIRRAGFGASPGPVDTNGVRIMPRGHRWCEGPRTRLG
jgi:hypothetical protein